MRRWRRPNPPIAPLSRHPGYHSDGDADFIDDIINVARHRLSTAAIEAPGAVDLARAALASVAYPASA